MSAAPLPQCIEALLGASLLRSDDMLQPDAILQRTAGIGALSAAPTQLPRDMIFVPSMVGVGGAGGAHHRTSGIDVAVTPERIILLDSQVPQPSDIGRRATSSLSLSLSFDASLTHAHVCVGYCTAIIQFIDRSRVTTQLDVAATRHSIAREARRPSGSTIDNNTHLNAIASP